MRLAPFNKAVRILLYTNSLILVAGAMLGPIYALFVEDIGGSLLDASLAGAIFALAAGLTTLIAGQYTDKIKENELIIVVGYGLMGLGFLLYTAVNSIWTLFMVEVIIGFAEALYSPAFDALYSKHLSLRKIGRGWGTWEAANYFSVALGSVLGGIIVNILGFDVLFILMAIFAFSSAVYIYHLPRRLL